MAQLADWITKLGAEFRSSLAGAGLEHGHTSPLSSRYYPDAGAGSAAASSFWRDQGLHYNPDETLIYRELAWFFHISWTEPRDANMYLQQQWANEMAGFRQKKADLESSFIRKPMTKAASQYLDQRV